MEVRRRKNENVGSFLYRFSKRIQQSGVLKEVRKRRVRSRPENKRKREERSLSDEEEGRDGQIKEIRPYPEK